MMLPSFRDTDEGLVATFPTDSIEDRLHMRGAQLDSLMSVVVSDDHFSILSTQIQSDILWLASTLSEEIRQLLQARLSPNAERPHQAAGPNEYYADEQNIADRDLAISAHSVISRARDIEHA
jgi:hypothetical protein